MVTCIVLVSVNEVGGSGLAYDAQLTLAVLTSAAVSAHRAEVKLADPPAVASVTEAVTS
jgi:hypothetical protein